MWRHCNAFLDNSISYFIIVVIDKPTDKVPEYSAWAADCPCGAILGTGKTVEEAKADFMNSIEELRELLDSDEWREYLDEEPCFYLRIE